MKPFQYLRLLFLGSLYIYGVASDCGCSSKLLLGSQESPLSLSSYDGLTEIDSFDSIDSSYDVQSSVLSSSDDLSGLNFEGSDLLLGQLDQYDSTLGSEYNLKNYDNRKDVQIVEQNDGKPIIVYAGGKDNLIKHFDPVERSDLPCDEKTKVFKGKAETIVHHQSPIIIKRKPTTLKIDHPPVIIRPNPVIFYRGPSISRRPVIHKHLPPKVEVQPYVVKLERPIEKKIILEKKKDCTCSDSLRENLYEGELPSGYKISEPEVLHSEIIEG